MLIRCVRVPNGGGSQTLVPQRGAMPAAGVGFGRIYQDFASGRHDAWPGWLP